MKLAVLFISSTNRIFTKLLKVSESSIKIKVRSHLTLFLFLFAKQRLLYGNDTVQYLSYAMTLTKTILERPHEELQGCYHWNTRTMFIGRLILGYFSHLNCHNFCLILTKVETLLFFKSTFKVSWSKVTSVQPPNKKQGLFEILKKITFSRTFLL